MRVKLALFLIILLIAIPHISAVDTSDWIELTVNNVDFKILDKYFNESKGKIKCELPKELDAFKDLDEVKNSLSISFNVDYNVGYWRKANHIHKWFVDNCADGKDECQKIWLGKEDLEKLRSVCAEVMQDHSKAEQLLPTCEGFFFGGTEYDKYYFNDIDKAMKILDACIKFLEEKEKAEDYSWRLYYQASW